jgi:hypothetical protein
MVHIRHRVPKQSFGFCLQMTLAGYKCSLSAEGRGNLFLFRAKTRPLPKALKPLAGMRSSNDCIHLMYLDEMLLVLVSTTGAFRLCCKRRTCVDQQNRKISDAVPDLNDGQRFCYNRDKPADLSHVYRGSDLCNRCDGNDVIARRCLQGRRNCRRVGCCPPEVQAASYSGEAILKASPAAVRALKSSAVRHCQEAT